MLLTIDRMDNLTHLAGMLRAAERCVIFTGAGISTESGIPAFRGPGSVWTTTDANAYSFKNYLASADLRRARWEVFRQGGMGAGALPNDGHQAVADLIDAGRVAAVITQNVDGLHATSGVPIDRLLELHGSNRYAKCLSCKSRYPRRDALSWPADPDQGVPRCPACGGLLKAGSISFGEPMPEPETSRAVAVSKASDLFVVVGSSLVVKPAALMPVHALHAGARLAIVNLTETPLDGVAEVVIREKAGTVLPALAALVT